LINAKNTNKKRRKNNTKKHKSQKKQKKNQNPTHIKPNKPKDKQPPPPPVLPQHGQGGERRPVGVVSGVLIGHPLQKVVPVVSGKHH
ncbi:hypothetical protein, partial [Stenotrophomonas maltophilia]|uniref:hypothetical protein n=1 Tax=Stenotrophomonas maltophilia TaxID=40324 RepID=UPI0034523CCB